METTSEMDEAIDAAFAVDDPDVLEQQDVDQEQAEVVLSGAERWSGKHDPAYDDMVEAQTREARIDAAVGQLFDELFETFRPYAMSDTPLQGSVVMAALGDIAEQPLILRRLAGFEAFADLPNEVQNVIRGLIHGHELREAGISPVESAEPEQDGTGEGAEPPEDVEAPPIEEPAAPPATAPDQGLDDEAIEEAREIILEMLVGAAQGVLHLQPPRGRTAERLLQHFLCRQGRNTILEQINTLPFYASLRAYYTAYELRTAFVPEVVTEAVQEAIAEHARSLNLGRAVAL